MLKIINDGIILHKNKEWKWDQIPHANSKKGVMLGFEVFGLLQTLLFKTSKTFFLSSSNRFKSALYLRFRLPISISTAKSRSFSSGVRVLMSRIGCGSGYFTISTSIFFPFLGLGCKG